MKKTIDDIKNEKFFIQNKKIEKFSDGRIKFFANFDLTKLSSEEKYPGFLSGKIKLTTEEKIDLKNEYIQELISFLEASEDESKHQRITEL